jgi:hypothetical protein
LNAGVHRQLLKPVELGGVAPGTSAAIGLLGGGVAKQHGERLRLFLTFPARASGAQVVNLALHFVHLRSRRRLLHFAERLGDFAFRASGTRRRNASGGVVPPETPACDGSPAAFFVGSLDPHVDQSRQVVIARPVCH